MSYSNKSAYVDWLRDYSWTYFCTFSFRAGFRRKAANRLFAEWINGVEAAEGARMSWVRVGEIGKNGKIHFHVLIAGSVRRMLRHEVHWQKMAGNLVVKRYEADRGGLEYVLKSMETSEDYDIDFQLHPQHKI
jgi:hypothetical protein